VEGSSVGGNFVEDSRGHVDSEDSPAADLGICKTQKLVSISARQRLLKMAPECGRPTEAKCSLCNRFESNRTMPSTATVAFASPSLSRPGSPQAQQIDLEKLKKQRVHTQLEDAEAPEGPGYSTD
jgi:hypothetical protein